MKKVFILAALLVSLSLISCRRVEEPIKLVSVCFNLDKGTKALADAIAATLPDEVELTLTSDRMATYKITTGKPVTIPAGTYTVTCSYMPTAEPSICGFPTIFLSKSPCFYVDEDVDIVEGKSDYSVGVTFSSWVLAVEDASSWTYSFSSNNDVEFPFLRDGNLWWVFCTGDMSGIALTMKKDGITYRITTSQSFAETLSGEVIVCSPGHWYILGNSYGQQGGGFSLNFPEWTEG